MDYKKIVHIAGKPGLYEVLNQRQDGLIVKSIEEGKSTFISSRINQFTMLDNISIYTEEDSEPLFEVFEKMLAQKEQVTVPKPKDKPEDLKIYFEKILPNYDKDQVYLSDIKKVVKWFAMLQPIDLAGMIEDRKKEHNKTNENEEE